MVPRPSSASWNIAEGALDQTITLLTQGETSARTRALLVEARRLRSRIASWRAIPPPPATRKEAFESAMQLLRKAGEIPNAPSGASISSAPPPRESGVTETARVVSSVPPVLESSTSFPSSIPPARAPSAAPGRPVSTIPPARVPSGPPAGPPLPKREVISPGVTIIRPRSMDWQSFRILEGVDIKVLHRDEEGFYRALIRLAPGSEIPRHRHVRVEDIFILEGSLEVDGVTMRSGEHCHAEIGSIHSASRSPSGCTFLLVGSEKNEIFLD
jgi:quercetin dioxygenase-like cupin family protein